MAKLYGVLTAGRGSGYARRSLTSNEYIDIDIALRRANGKNVVLRVRTTGSEVSLLQFDGRWADAEHADPSTWKMLGHITDHVEISNDAS